MDGSSHRGPRVVAVFGGNRVPAEVGEVARRTARRIAGAGGVVLSGGAGSSSRNVKDEANAAARAAGRWVAVLNSTGRPRGCSPEDAGLVLRPEIGDQRNLLEASLCDACVVLAEGAGGGTLSELVAALCLGRPVLLLGDPAADGDWRTVHGWFGPGVPGPLADDDAARRVVDRVRATLGTSPLLAPLVDAHVTTGNLRLGDGCSLLSPADDDAARTWIEQRVTERPLGRFPDVAGPDQDARELRDLGPAYEAWLASHAG